MKRKIEFIGKLFLAVSVCLMAQIVFAQSQPSSAMLGANELFKAQKWTEAAKAYEEVTKAEPQNARAWYQLAMSRHSLGQYEQAIAAFQKNLAINSANGNAMYNIACGYAKLGQKEKALEWLAKALETNAALFLNPAADADFESLRNEARFKELVAISDKKQKPCMYSAEARQFDFWVGEWEVFSPQGQKAGISKIEQISVGCGILENWTNSGTGYGGKSINFYSPSTGKWYQHWIGADGNPQTYWGVYKDNAMRYEGEAVAKDGSKTLLRLTFFNLDPNTVRQFAEQSTDGGKTWTVQYDFKYVRKK